MEFEVRHALACRIARQTEVYRTFAFELHRYRMCEATPRLVQRQSHTCDISITQKRDVPALTSML